MKTFLISLLFLFSYHVESSSGYKSSGSGSSSAPQRTVQPRAVRPSTTSPSRAAQRPSSSSSSRSNSNSAPRSNFSAPSAALPSASAPPTVQSSGPIEYDPVVKSKASLTSHLYSLPREGVTINNIKLVGDSFQITGVYKDKTSLRQFVEVIKGEGEIDRKVEVKRKSTFFAGERTRTYKIMGVNLWE